MSEATAGRRLRLGVIASEFPPDHGGMAMVARGFARSLTETDDVVVFTLPGHRDASVPCEQRGILTGDVHTDAARLAECDVDAWLGLNAGLVPLASRLSRPFFVYLHGNDFLDPWLPAHMGPVDRLATVLGVTAVSRGLRRVAIRRHAPRLRHAFTNSGYTKALASSALNGAAPRMTVCPPGVDEEFFQESGRRPNGSFHVLTVARLSRWAARKNVEGVIRAVARLRAEIPIAYTVVGDGDDRARLERLARDLGVADAVRFTGGIDRAALLACYREADLFVLAPIATPHDVEGFGIVYLEASASGVPVICSSVGGATEAVSEGWNGLVLSGSSPDDIAGAIRRVIESRVLFRPERVRAFAERFRWGATARRLRDTIVRDLDAA